WPADIDFFNDGRFVICRSNCFFERIEINDHKINDWNFILLHFLYMRFIFSFAEDATKNRRMECFDPSAKYRRVASERFNRCYFYAQFFNKCLCSTCRIDGNSLLMEKPDDIFESILIKNGDQR